MPEYLLPTAPQLTNRPNKALKREEQVKTSTPEINNTDIVKIAKSISESIAVLNGTGIASISRTRQ